MRIFLLSQSLDYGGAERQLALLAPGLATRGHDVAVALFCGGGPFEAGLQKHGVRVHNLAKAGRWEILGFFRRLVGLLSRERPDVVYSFLPVPNIMVALASIFLDPGPRVVFGVRSSGVALGHYDWLARWSYRLEALLSSRAHLVIVNSERGLVDIKQRGFRSRRTAVVPNGFDTDAFRHDPVARNAVRREWRVPADTILVGHAGRLDPMKGHDIFLDAAALLVQKNSRLHFVCIGGGDNAFLARLKTRAKDLGVNTHITWAGLRADMERCFSALDIFCSSSRFGEGFPNVIAEAMACGVPCVTTDVGDARLIVGECGVVVKPDDAHALADGIANLAARDNAARLALGAAARRSIVDRFGVERLAAETDRVLMTELKAGNRAVRRA